MTAPAVETATCRGCGRELRGKPYYRGGNAFDPVTGEQCKKNYYGGYVCSSRCDFKSSLELEQSMPGHGITQRRLTGFSAQHYRDNWGDMA